MFKKYKSKFHISIKTSKFISFFILKVLQDGHVRAGVCRHVLRVVWCVSQAAVDVCSSSSSVVLKFLISFPSRDPPRIRGGVLGKRNVKYTRTQLLHPSPPSITSSCDTSFKCANLILIKNSSFYFKLLLYCFFIYTRFWKLHKYTRVLCTPLELLMVLTK